MKNWTVIFILIGISIIFSACGVENYACVAVHEQDQDSWCVMDSKAECDGIDEDEGWNTQYYEGESCQDRGFSIDCGNGSWEDKNSDCS